VSESPEGPGWWQASDGKWYPPEQAPGYQAAPGGGGVTATGGTDLGSVFTYSWNKFIQNIGEWIVLWLILIAVYVVVAIVSVAAIAGASLGGFSFRFNFVGIIIGIIAGIIYGLLYVALAKAAVQSTNGQKIDIAACFKFTGNNIAAAAIFGLVLGILNAFCGLLGIVAWLFLGFLPILSALDDKGADAVSESISISTEHASEAMVWMLISWFIAGVICALGAPIAMTGGVYLVKRYRGEPVAP
jgi:hypothetical protein